MNRPAENTRVARAVLLAPLSMLLVVWFGGFGLHLYDLLTHPNYHAYANLYLSGMATLGYMVLVAAVITLVYGLQVYLLLRHFRQASLRNLILAGGVPFIVLDLVLTKSFASGLVFAGFGALVAATFWLVVTPHPPAVNVWIKKSMRVLVALMLGLWLLVLLADALFS